jgi:hypothetical protein
MIEYLHYMTVLCFVVSQTFAYSSSVLRIAQRERLGGLLRDPALGEPTVLSECKANEVGRLSHA